MALKAQLAGGNQLTITLQVWLRIKLRMTDRQIQQAVSLGRTLKPGPLDCKSNALTSLPFDLWKNFNVQIFWIRTIIIQRDITSPFVYFSCKMIMLKNMLLGRWEKLSFSIITNPVTFMIVWPKQRENMCQQRDMSKFACSCKKFVKNWRNRKIC